MTTFSNPFCAQPDRNNPRKHPHRVVESDDVYIRHQKLRRTMETEKLRHQATQHPLDADLTLFQAAAARIDALETKLDRLVKASNAMRQDIISRIEPDADGFQPYDGNREIWTEFCEAMRAAEICATSNKTLPPTSIGETP